MISMRLLAAGAALGLFATATGCNSQQTNPGSSVPLGAPRDANTDAAAQTSDAEQHFLTVATQSSPVLSKLPSNVLLQLGHAVCTDLSNGPLAGAVTDAQKAGLDEFAAGALVGAAAATLCAGTSSAGHLPAPTDSAPSSGQGSTATPAKLSEADLSCDIANAPYFWAHSRSGRYVGRKAKIQFLSGGQVLSGSLIVTVVSVGGDGYHPIPPWVGTQGGADNCTAALLQVPSSAPTASSRATNTANGTPRLNCKITGYRDGPSGGLEAIFKTGGADSSSDVRVTFTAEGAGSTSKYVAHVAVGQGGTVPEADNIPVGITGATAPPDRCVATPDG